MSKIDSDCYRGRYVQMGRIGSGAYGVIYMVKDTATNQILTAKHVSLHNITPEKGLKQFEILRQLRHPHIVKYVDSMANKEELILIMEYCGEKDLAYHIQTVRKERGRFPETLVINWLFQLIIATQFMHSKKILHRDLKPQNIFVDSQFNLKIGDFGISKIMASTLEGGKTSVGTVSYMAPEMYTSDRYTNKTDIWALGCIIYEVCALERLFPMRDKQGVNMGLFKVMDSVKSSKLPELPEPYSEGFRNIVRLMLDRDPQRRPSAYQLMQNNRFLKLMMNNTSTNSLKSEYSRSFEKQVINEEVIDRQTDLVERKLRKFEEELKTKMGQLKERKVSKSQFNDYYKEVRSKMKEIEVAVKSAFGAIHKEADIDGEFLVSTDSQQPLRASQEYSKAGNSRKKITSPMKGEASKVSNESDITIQSVELPSLQSQSRRESCQEKAARTPRSPRQRKTESSAKPIMGREDSGFVGEQVHANLAETSESRQFLESPRGMRLGNKEGERRREESPETLRSSYVESEMSQTIGRLNSIRYTLKKHPEVALSNSLEFSSSNYPESKESAAKLLKAILQSGLQSPRNSDNTLNFEALEEEDEYSQDFQSYEEELEPGYSLRDTGRQQEMGRILNMYKETLNELTEPNQMGSESAKIRAKYLLMSEIRQQSNEGGSTIGKSSYFK